MRSKYAAGRKNKAIPLSDIKEDMVLIEGSNTDYITMSGCVYADYDDNMFYKKKVQINRNNGYAYVGINFINGGIKSRRLHVLIAKAFIPNPDPINLRVVGHKNNNKSDNRIENLYWTTNQENTKKAVDDGLSIPKHGKDNPDSIPIKVIDKNTYEVVGIYESISDCGAHIENVTKAHISKVCHKSGYKPRTRKYIYQIATDEDMSKYNELLNLHLTENNPTDRNPVMFTLENKKTGYKNTFDNQKAAEKVCGIKQSDISNILKNSYSEVGDWCFKRIGKIPYKESSCYQNFINSIDNLTIQNIYTNEIRVYNTTKELNEDFGLRGHDLKHYIRTGQTLMNEWKMIPNESQIL